MALSTEDIRAAAERLDRAEKTRTQIRQLSQEFPAITIDDAYAVQKAWMEIKVSSGRVVKGHKIGLTSKAMQSALNIEEPDSGVLLDDMFFADGGIVPTERFIATRVEAELAFVMAKRLSRPDCTMFDVLNATDFVVPALEILDTRVERVDPKTKATRKIFDTIADNAANAGIVLGGRPIRPLEADLRWIGALCFKNGQLENGTRGRRAQSSRHGCRLACQQDRAAWARARGGTGRAGGIVHPPDRDPQGRHNPGRLWRLRLGELLFRLTTTIGSETAMPHFTIEYSANLDRRVDMAKVVEVVRKAATETGIFPLGGIRVRAIKCEHYAIADGNPNLGFLDMVLRLGEGRDLAARQKAGEHVFKALSAHLDPVFAQTKFALSFDMQINDKETSWKRNNIHEALKAEAAHG